MADETEDGREWVFDALSILINGSNRVRPSRCRLTTDYVNTSEETGNKPRLWLDETVVLCKVITSHTVTTSMLIQSTCFSDMQTSWWAGSRVERVVNNLKLRPVHGEAARLVTQESGSRLFSFL